ncbi:hypothetical protein C497_06849 [Halalkalicoccus jeotgali B3]|uniref:Uncharacterized protein n=1 Tax=Halalkalicoccus jeotgali (strain DSM 18796 / CECT 7217 / JCM 14584 / KCTC 4019 / B3) TaxID=795797 RepID=D8JC18_HALJB|nr:hypothetical protein HacjB3_17913 [Halalkalicoccus jeotgali B3]ELY38638.1 hypothetical protein C497_06849 [Halalkalicoccus jeotgali B3]
MKAESFRMHAFRSLQITLTRSLFKSFVNVILRLMNNEFRK